MNNIEGIRELGFARKPKRSISEIDLIESLEIDYPEVSIESTWEINKYALSVSLFRHSAKDLSV